ncbi:MAG TPA: hypothetical protein VG455_04185 [Acidimicrobiales bacterium]|nr:hypothetical protein [Acidimicrobiales bacterium]
MRSGHSSRRRAALVAALVTAATALGACSTGSGSGEAEAPPGRAPEAAPSTSGVPTTVAAGPSTVPAGAPRATRPSGGATTVPRQPAAYPGIYPETTWEALRATEAAFGQGHQPWRGDPVDVARLYLEDQLALAGVGSLAASGPEGLEVAYMAGGVPGAVHLARPAGSVAVVVGSDTSRLDAVRVSRSGDELLVELTSRATGTVHAMAGAFQSEWTVTRASEVTSGARVHLTLDTGLGDAPLLLRLRHEGGDGVVAVAERRVN